ncbi:MAG TPA: hypothetical protein VF002_07045 [Gaiellaceae bacterium]
MLSVRVKVDFSAIRSRALLRLAGCVLVLLLVSAPAADAGLLSGLLPGLLSPSDTPSSCSTAASQPFAPWGDSSSYVLAPGGDFENGAPGWTLGRGATVVSGNEPYYVHASTDSHSLYIPAGSFATTPPMCFAFGDWHLRFFAASSSASLSSLRVEVVVKSLLGILSVLDGGTVAMNSSWHPSPRLGMLLTNLTGLVSTDAVSFRFVPNDRASWRIDDVYLDPWKDT